MKRWEFLIGVVALMVAFAVLAFVLGVFEPLFEMRED